MVFLTVLTENQKVFIVAKIVASVQMKKNQLSKKTYI